MDRLGLDSTPTPTLGKMPIFPRMLLIVNSYRDSLTSFFQNRYFTLFVAVFRVVVELGDPIHDRVSR